MRRSFLARLDLERNSEFFKLFEGIAEPPRQKKEVIPTLVDVLRTCLPK